LVAIVSKDGIEKDIRLVRVFSTEMEALKEYIQALYRHDEDFDSMIHIEAGVKSLLRNEALATPYFIKQKEERIGYVILTRYHSVEKGGLTIYIDELFVEEHFRRQGVGRGIMGRIREIARAQGAKALWAQSEPHNEAAEKFFLNEGFQPNHYKNFEHPL